MVEPESESNNLLDKLHPHDFDILPIRTSWEPPCWISVYAVLIPQSDAAKASFPFPVRYPFVIDAFAKKTVNVQLSSAIWEEMKRVRTLAPQWWEYLWRDEAKYLKALSDLTSIVPALFRIVPRAEFKDVKLDEVLQQNPERMEIYLTDDTNAEGHEFTVLRIHTSLQGTSPADSLIWYQKKVPWRLQTEDIIPWFHSTIKKLPKKKQPIDFESWDRKLIAEHSDLEPPKESDQGNWSEKPRITLVFGTLDEIGYAVLFHMDRDLIDRFLRNGSVIEIWGSVRVRYKNTVFPNYHFYLFTPSSLHAEVVESMLFGGSIIHFGIGPHITGMIALQGDTVSCIGVSKATIKKYCDRPNMTLVSYEPTRFKHKTYTYRETGYKSEYVTEIL